MWSKEGGFGGGKSQVDPPPPPPSLSSAPPPPPPPPLPPPAPARIVAHHHRSPRWSRATRMVVAARYSTNTPFFVAALLERWLCQEDRRYWARLAYTQSPFSLRDRSICFATSMELSRLWTARHRSCCSGLLVASFLPFSLSSPPARRSILYRILPGQEERKPRDRQCCSPDRFDRTRREKRNRGKKEKKKKKRKERKGKKNVARNLRVSPIFNSSFPSPTDSSTRIICARIFPTFEKKKEKKEKTNYLGERERERRLASSREFVEVSRNGEIEGRRWSSWAACCSCWRSCREWVSVWHFFKPYSFYLQSIILLIPMRWRNEILSNVSNQFFFLSRASYRIF